MAVFTTWTVLPNDGIEKLADNLWRVSGKMQGGSQRQMVMARRKDGRIVVHNAIALDDAGMKELTDWGEVATIFVPNGFHRQDAAIWKQRFPKASIMTPGAARKRVQKVVPVDLFTEDVKVDDETVAIRALPGVPIESLMEVRSGDDLTVVFTDAILNMPRVGGPMGIMLAPTGTISTPRLMRWIAVKDRKKFVAELERLAGDKNLKRVMPGHGAPVYDDPAGALRKVIAQLS